MLPQVCAVDIDIRDQLGAVELQEDLASRRRRWHGVVEAIPTRAAIIAVAAVLVIERVPGMGQGHTTPAGPVVVEACPSEGCAPQKGHSRFPDERRHHR